MTQQNTAISLLRKSYSKLGKWRLVASACGKAESQITGWMKGEKMSDTTAEILILRLAKK